MIFSIMHYVVQISNESSKNVTLANVLLATKVRPFLQILTSKSGGTCQFLTLTVLSPQTSAPAALFLSVAHTSKFPSNVLSQKVLTAS